MGQSRKQSSLYSVEQRRLVERIKKARIESGLSQVEVARLMDRTQPYISKLEAGQKLIDVVELIYLARLFKKDVTWFLKDFTSKRGRKRKKS